MHGQPDVRASGSTSPELGRTRRDALARLAAGLEQGRYLHPSKVAAWAERVKQGRVDRRARTWPRPTVAGIVPDMDPTSLLAGLLDLVFAPVCLGCDGAIRAGAPGGKAGRLICGRCRSRMRPPPAPLCSRCGGPLPRTGRAPAATCPECEDWPPTLRAARSAHLHAPPADRLVHQLKYRGWKALAEPMAHAMARIPLPLDVEEEASIVVPVPTTPVRLRERGYNQAAMLADAYARLTRRDAVPLLQRAAGAASQTNLQAAARGANVAGAFRIVAGAARRLEGAHLLLVDDVLTTGATAGECTRTLVAAGARCVSVITFARTLDVRRLAMT